MSLFHIINEIARIGIKTSKDNNHKMSQIKDQEISKEINPSHWVSKEGLTQEEMLEV